MLGGRAPLALPIQSRAQEAVLAGTSGFRVCSVQPDVCFFEVMAAAKKLPKRNARLLAVRV